MPTLNDVYLELRKYLKKALIEQPEFEAREILRVLVGKDVSSFMRDIHQYVEDRTAAKALSLAQKREHGMPLAYVLGQWDFHGLTLEVTPDVLIPRPDTEVLADLAISTLREHAPDGRFLDLCCGSGCVGLAVASELPELKVVLADTSVKALEVARRNARELHNIIIITEACAKQPPSPALGEFNVIAANPPYVSDDEYMALEPSVREHEPELALRGGADGLDVIRAIAEHWYFALRPGGYMMLETGYNQARQTAQILQNSGYAEVSAHRDLQDYERVVVARRPA
ncbi:MAG: peptide chain release factor N(5)-glutamine methyltransferase [Oscillospiraceae bacterium]|jgi:release factor glutamine methyltransferase|nr:peptide chain release factor N(5)-glutamine methyltransferase [Oscillospiraceae bacterium]